MTTGPATSEPTDRPTPTGLGVPTNRTTLRRKPERGAHDRESVNAILDAAFVCHLGLIDATGAPVVLPTTYVRVGDHLMIHGSPASRLLRHATSPTEVCMTVTITDGIVLARSAFHHSVNYRCVVVFGQAAEVVDLDEKRTAMHALVEHLVDGRTNDCRPPTDRELKSTTVLRLALDECSAKVRVGGPVDDDNDMDLGYWAGVIPVSEHRGTPVPDQGITTKPDYLYAAAPLA